MRPGFSLIELVVSIAVMGLVLSASFAVMATLSSDFEDRMEHSTASVNRQASFSEMQTLLQDSDMRNRIMQTVESGDSVFSNAELGGLEAWSSPQYELVVIDLNEPTPCDLIGTDRLVCPNRTLFRDSAFQEEGLTIEIDVFAQRPVPRIQRLIVTGVTLQGAQANLAVRASDTNTIPTRVLLPTWVLLDTHTGQVVTGEY